MISFLLQFFLISRFFLLVIHWLSLIYQYHISLSLYHWVLSIKWQENLESSINNNGERTFGIDCRCQKWVRPRAIRNFSYFDLFSYNRGVFCLFWGGGRNHGSVVSRTVVSRGLPVFFYSGMERLVKHRGCGPATGGFDPPSRHSLTVESHNRWWVQTPPSNIIPIIHKT